MKERLALERRAFSGLMTSIGAGYFISGATSVLANDAAQSSRPALTSGISSGDVDQQSAIVWSRCDRPARMLVEISEDQSFKRSRRVIGPEVLSTTDYTGKLRLTDLEPGQRTWYRVFFRDLDGRRRLSESTTGSFVTAPSSDSDITFLWSGDTAGQGFGIDTDRGGMLSYKAMHEHRPDFFVHSGDACYADGPFPKSIELDDGTLWQNVTTPETSKVAETIDEFRANYRYNMMDEHLKTFHGEVPVFAQWDDHETTNNWYPGEKLDGDDRYLVKSVSLLAARAKRAFLEYMPIRSFANRPTSIHRKVNYGPLLDLFFLDLRSFRGPNTFNRQQETGRDTAFMGNHQLEWLKSSLSQSRATWKVICSDMPLGLIVGDGENFENCANGDGPALGRELEIASLLRSLRANHVENIIWLTADVHYAASHYYDPNQAVFQDFTPFWEFVSGPLHAGTFGPGKLDNTFGPQVKFCSIPNDMKPNRPPSEGLQFFGKVKIDSESKVLSVSHFNQAGQELWSTDLTPQS